MQLSKNYKITCPVCNVKQSPVVRIAQTAIKTGNATVQVGEPYMICGFTRCQHLMRGKDLDAVNDIPVSCPADFRRATTILNQ